MRTDTCFQLSLISLCRVATPLGNRRLGNGAAQTQPTAHLNRQKTQCRRTAASCRSRTASDVSAPRWASRSSAGWRKCHEVAEASVGQFRIYERLILERRDLNRTPLHNSPALPPSHPLVRLCAASHANPTVGPAMRSFSSKERGD